MTPAAAGAGLGKLVLEAASLTGHRLATGDVWEIHAVAFSERARQVWAEEQSVQIIAARCLDLWFVTFTAAFERVHSRKPATRDEQLAADRHLREALERIIDVVSGTRH